MVRLSKYRGTGLLENSEPCELSSLRCYVYVADSDAQAEDELSQLLRDARAHIMHLRHDLNPADFVAWSQAMQDWMLAVARPLNRLPFPLPRTRKNAMRLAAPLLALCLLVSAGGATAQRELPDFTKLVEDNGGAVVNISTTSAVRRPAAPNMPDIEDDEIREFFRRFIPRQQPGPGHHRSALPAAHSTRRPSRARPGSGSPLGRGSGRDDSGR